MEIVSHICVFESVRGAEGAGGGGGVLETFVRAVFAKELQRKKQKL